MIWTLIFVYLLAGGVIARMAWEYDMFADDTTDWRTEATVCWMLVLLWPLLAVLTAWTYVTKRDLRR